MRYNAFFSTIPCLFWHAYQKRKYYSRTFLARTSLSRTYPYVEVFSRSRSHCSLFQYNSTSIRRIYISKFFHTSNEFQSPITISSVYMGVLRQNIPTFFLIFPDFSKLGPLFKKTLKILKNVYL